MSTKPASQAIEILECPVTKERKIPLVFYFESKKEDIEKTVLGHQARWIIEALKEHPMPQRKEIYEKLTGATKPLG